MMFVTCAGCAQPESCGNNERCFGESARGVAASGMPLKSLTGAVQTLRPDQLPTPADPAWERGRAGEQRDGGGFMPFLDASGDQMGVKEYGERRHEVDEARDRQRNAPTPIMKEA